MGLIPVTSLELVMSSENDKTESFMRLIIETNDLDLHPSRHLSNYLTNPV